MSLLIFTNDFVVRLFNDNIERKNTLHIVLTRLLNSFLILNCVFELYEV